MPNLFDSSCDMDYLLYRSMVCILLYRCFVIFIDAILELYFLKDRMIVVLYFYIHLYEYKGLTLQFVFFNLIMLINIFILLCLTLWMIMTYFISLLQQNGVLKRSWDICWKLPTYPMCFYSIWMLQKHIGVMQYWQFVLISTTCFQLFWWLDSFNCAVSWHTLVSFTSWDFWVCVFAF